MSSNENAVMVEIQLLVNALKDTHAVLENLDLPVSGMSDHEHAVAIDAVLSASELLGSMVPSHEEAAGNDPVEL